MARYIDADKFKQAIKGKEVFQGYFDNGFIYDELHRQPTADVEEVKRGKWEHECLQCSACKRNISEICDADSYLTSDIEHELLFCPFCGAKMDGGIE